MEIFPNNYFTLVFYETLQSDPDYQGSTVILANSASECSKRIKLSDHNSLVLTCDFNHCQVSHAALELSPLLTATVSD